MLKVEQEKGDLFSELTKLKQQLAAGTNDKTTEIMKYNEELAQKLADAKPSKTSANNLERKRDSLKDDLNELRRLKKRAQEQHEKSNETSQDEIKNLKDTVNKEIFARGILRRSCEKEARELEQQLADSKVQIQDLKV
ncbi:hypothetical protein GYMLUDRAFT_65495 [Collybiopsis luxurians FD-317 M1]|uniref:Uncharacterized protein n=1 Tax=Collybiopsis luxurians FD-317 M1 TaxID=944289 RepID=A0A0D0B754_9AGAR|nr:hypothetical protein GYMLUDRAFT_65495 [Collybiopsis luxurians FD-317 M1]